MPYSSSEGKDWIARILGMINPRSVVDVGPGAGAYVRLCSAGTGARWTGIEIHEPYVRRFNLDQLYDKLIIGDAREVKLPKADAYVLGDVLEHLPREDVEPLLARIKTVTPNVIVSLPIVEWPQGAVDGNEHEAHLYHWSAQEMYEVLQPCAVRCYAAIGAFYWHRGISPKPSPTIDLSTTLIDADEVI